jgi:hypothetical protein
VTQLWPRLNPALARALFNGLGGSSVEGLASGARNEHAQTTYAATGGARVTAAEVGALVTELRTTAAEFGYPVPADDGERIGFDRACAEVLFRRMDTTTVEAAHRGVWNFLALVAAPDLVQWRFGRGNVERWIASDLTRHMFSRLWWQALTFSASTVDGRTDFSLLRALSESDLNQITERRSLAGNPRLARAVARVVLSDTGSRSRRSVLRDLTPRLRRRLAFIDFSVLTDEQLDDHVRALAHSTAPT